MKLYTFAQEPSPRRVHIFLDEKSLKVEQLEIDLRAGAHFSDAFAARSPSCTVPVLELDDGRCLFESVAICRYLESIAPEPCLLGADAIEQALVCNWDHWVEFNGLLAVMEAFRNRVERMADHALPGRRPVTQIPALAERGVQRYRWFLEDLDARLADAEFIAGSRYSVADITARVTIDFAARAIKVEPLEDQRHLCRWYEDLSRRPAILAHSPG